MICCVIAGAFIVKYVIGARKLGDIFGIRKKKTEEPYGFRKYCELDEYAG